MSSLISAAKPTGDLSAPFPLPLTGASLIFHDANPPGAVCTYTAHCDPISCSAIKDTVIGSELTVQRFLAYRSVVNFNNYLNNIMNMLLDSGTIATLTDANLVENYFTIKAPSATWSQIMSIFTPFLSIWAAQAIKSFGETFKVAA